MIRSTIAAPGATNFMVLTRATLRLGPTASWRQSGDVGVDESADDTAPGQHDDLLRRPEPDLHLALRRTRCSCASMCSNADGDPVATGKLIEGANGGMATWAEVKAQAADMLGIQLTDQDVGNVPLLADRPVRQFHSGAPTAIPQLITGIGIDGIPNTDGRSSWSSGNSGCPGSLRRRSSPSARATPSSPTSPTTRCRTASPTATSRSAWQQSRQFDPGVYDNELLDAHFIAGDGRVNENIGLTAVHHVFHSEHNRLVEHTKAVVLASSDVAFLNEWLAVDVARHPGKRPVDALVWDGERLFQAAKFGTEMQYQHLVFEEFARKIQPTINVFLVPDGFDTTMNPVDRRRVRPRGLSLRPLDADRDRSTGSTRPSQTDHISLIEGFLNPTAFNGADGAIDDDIAAGAIIRGMTRQVGNEIDEFVTSALRNNLLGLPLDLATINLARGRDTGVPSLNAARRQFYEATNQDVLLKPYESWVDFAGHLKNEASIINFIAAYGTHSLITGQTTIEGKRDAALTIITGVVGRRRRHRRSCTFDAIASTSSTPPAPMPAARSAA